MTTCKRCAGEYRCNCKRRTSPIVRAHMRKISPAGAQKAAYAKRVQSWQRWTQMVKGMTVQEAWRFVWRQGYNAGYERRRRMEKTGC